jgi:hypothetical protein
MGKINIAGIVKGGLLAGLVINIGGSIQNELVMKDQWDAALQSLNRAPISGASALWLIVMGFVMGMALVWIYAAVSPRFGQRHKAAVAAGLITWLLVCSPATPSRIQDFLKNQHVGAWRRRAVIAQFVRGRCAPWCTFTPCRVGRGRTMEIGAWSLLV